MRLTNQPNYWLLNDPDVDRVLISHKIVTEPGSYTQAMVRTDVPIWIKVMKTEMDQHQETGIWTLVDLPPDRAVIGCQWVYAVKTHPDGTFQKAKA